MLGTFTKATVHNWGTAGEFPLIVGRRRYVYRMDSLPEYVNGLPLHPLVVHAAVVLVPLAGILGLLMVIVPRFSVRFGPLVAVIGLLGLGAAFLAKESGERLQAQIGEASALHVESGDIFPIFAGVQAVLILLLWIADRRGGRGLFGLLMAVFTVVAVVLTAYWTYRTGESGAASVWKELR